MHVTMVKKKLRDGSECRKCAQAAEQLRARGLLDRIDEIVWAEEGDPDSPGIVLGQRHGIDTAPFFIVRDDAGEHVYTSVMLLIRERLGQSGLGSRAGAADRSRRHRRDLTGVDRSDRPDGFARSVRSLASRKPSRRGRSIPTISARI